MWHLYTTCKVTSRPWGKNVISPRWCYIYIRLCVYGFSAHESSFIMYRVHTLEKPSSLFLSLSLDTFASALSATDALSFALSFSASSSLCLQLPLCLSFSSSFFPCVYLPVSFHLYFLPATCFCISPNLSLLRIVYPVAVCSDWQHTNKEFLAMG